ncbi:uncharacterized protein LOC106667794 [Cimex lectularius]|uniref:GPI-GlcNAc transferase complex PIG-H component conserved domain-containing protein n=1 Tax=Cimex lectularius TaxID=79782 RepID=A0A8I6TF73_CIMLE|nr:uncharacterized protein LOC106667794 [Cimex lectularius]
MCPGSEDSLKTKSYSNGSLEKASYKQFSFRKSYCFVNKLTVTVYSLLFLTCLLDGECHARKCFYATLVSVVFGLQLLSAFYTVIEEHLLLVVPLRIQMTSIYYYGQQSTVSIPWYKIADLMIIDEITCQQVLPFLAVQFKEGVTIDGQSHIILFPNMRPRLAHLERIYRDLQQIIDANR